MSHPAQAMSELALLHVLIALGVTILAARAGGELARRLRQPEVLGELFAGLVLGPSVLGVLAPGVREAVFLDPAVVTSLSAFSWVGAILLLVIAGLEVDLGILRRRAKPGAFAAVGAIVPSVILGVLFGRWAFPGGVGSEFMLGVVLSVTAVSVVAKVLIEREVLRRDFAQVLLAAGIAGEVVVWPLVAVASGIRSDSPAPAAIRSAVFAAAFLALMATLGRRFIFWAMRRVSDSAQIINGPLSLVLVTSLAFAAITNALGLHPLLGAFVLGMVLAPSPRVTEPLLRNIQALTTGMFAPIFFATAGMRVDVLQLRTPGAWLVVGALILAATAVKVLPAWVGAVLGGLRAREAAIVGFGLNMKGGTDVIVAIIGVELGLLSPAAYTSYAVVAILSVLITPAILAKLEAIAPPSEEEQQRLAKEEADRRAYVPRLERILVPVLPQVAPELAVELVSALARAKHDQGQILDVTELTVEEDGDNAPPQQMAKAERKLEKVDALETAEVSKQVVPRRRTVRELVEATKDHDIVAIGSALTRRMRRLSFGRLQDALIQRAESDVLVVINRDHKLEKPRAKRILVPITGFEYSMAASDVAAFLALGSDSEIVLFHAIHRTMDSVFWRELDHRRLRESAQWVLDEAAFRIGRLGVRIDKRAVISDDAGAQILRELKRQPYDLVVLGGVRRGASGLFSLGASVERVLGSSPVPAVLLLSREPSPPRMH